jgi:glutathione S-transferase
MVQLADGDIKTREVLDWRGVHLFHFIGSSCSQKIRVFLNLKNVEWESHLVDLMGAGNITEWYLGINPRGLVPTLVLDGAVHIESNDILAVLEERFPEPRLIPAGRESEIAALLTHEDDLHLDLRNLSFRFVFGREGPPKSPETLAAYRSGGSGTVLGKADPNKDREIEFWERAAAEGFTDETVRRSAHRFQTAFDKLDNDLAGNPYLLGNALTVLDIAWFIYVNRLTLAGYPVARLHPNLAAWFEKLSQRPEFTRETRPPPEVQANVDATIRKQEQAGATLPQVVGF